MDEKERDERWLFVSAPLWTRAGGVSGVEHGRTCGRRRETVASAGDDLDSFFDVSEKESERPGPTGQDASLWPGLRVQPGQRNDDRRYPRGTRSTYRGGRRETNGDWRRADSRWDDAEMDSGGRNAEGERRNNQSYSDYQTRNYRREPDGSSQRFSRHERSDQESRESWWDRKDQEDTGFHGQNSYGSRSYDRDPRRRESRYNETYDRSQFRNEYKADPYNRDARDANFRGTSRRDTQSYDRNSYSRDPYNRDSYGRDQHGRNTQGRESTDDYYNYQTPTRDRQSRQFRPMKESRGQDRPPSTSLEPNRNQRPVVRRDIPSVDEIAAPTQAEVRRNARDMSYRGGRGRSKPRTNEHDRPRVIDSTDMSASEPEDKQSADSPQSSGNGKPPVEEVPFVRKGLEMMTKEEYEELEEGGFRLRKDGSVDYDYILKTPKQREQERMDKLKARRESRRQKKRGKDGRMQVGGGKSGGQVTEDGQFIDPTIVQRTREAILKRERGQPGPDTVTAYDPRSEEWFVDEREAPSLRIDEELERIEAQQRGGVSDADLNYLPARLRRLADFPKDYERFDAWYTDLEDILDHVDFNDQSLLQVWTSIKIFSEVSEVHDRSARAYLQGSSFLTMWTARAEGLINRYIGSEPVEILGVFAHFSLQPSARLLSLWYETMTLSVHRLDPTALVNIILYFTKLNIRPKQDFVFLWYASFKKSLEDFSAKHLVDLLYAFGSLRTLPSKEFLLIWYEKAETNFPKWRPEFFPKSLMSFVKMNLKPNDDFVQQWMAFGEDKFQSMSAEHMSDSIYALALLGLETEDWMDEAWIAAATVKLPYCSNIELSNIMYALGTLNLNPGSELLNMCDQGLEDKLGNLNSHSVAHVMLAHGELQVPPTQTFTANWFSRATTIMEAFTLDEYFSLVEAIGVLGLKPTFEFIDSWFVLCEQRLAKLNRENLIRIIGCIAKMGVQWSDDFALSWYAAVEEKLSSSDGRFSSELQGILVGLTPEAPESLHLAIAAASVMTESRSID